MQSMLFEEDADAVFDSPPAGLSYQGKFISASEEIALLRSVRELPFKNFEFHGYQGKRRTVSFGWHYEFSGAGRLRLTSLSFCSRCARGRRRSRSCDLKRSNTCWSSNTSRAQVSAGISTSRSLIK